MKEKFFAGIICILGIFLVLEGCGERSDQAKLAERGIEVMSQPITEYNQRTKRGVTMGYEVSPTFQTTTGQTYTCHGNVSESIINQLKYNPVIEIKYLLNDPSICAVDHAETSGIWFAILIGLGMALGSVAYIYNRSSL
ncbi:hypothetical protein [Acinetobacter sp.]|uniref:hypothetical protein n=1 Tax=Acinetobacter sp. TaxID=472 RepID=UPI00388F2FBB